LLEEEVIPAADFLFYLSQCLPLLEYDQTLIGATAWNENGQFFSQLIRCAFHAILVVFDDLFLNIIYGYFSIVKNFHLVLREAVYKIFLYCAVWSNTLLCIYPYFETAINICCLKTGMLQRSVAWRWTILSKAEFWNLSVYSIWNFSWLSGLPTWTCV